MRSLSIFLLVTASRTGNAGSRRRNLGGLDGDLFSSVAPAIGTSGPSDRSLEYGSTVPIADDYGSNLALSDTTPSDTSVDESLGLWGSTDYTSALGETGSDSGSDLALLEENPDPNTHSASLADLDLFGSDYISDAGCSGATVSGKVRRDQPMCLNRNDVKKPTQNPPKIPHTAPDPPPVGPQTDPPWIRFFEKPAPRIPNDIYDPRFDVVEQEQQDVQPSTSITGPCPFRFTYVCCELHGQPPQVMSDVPTPDCVQCTLPPYVLALIPINSEQDEPAVTGCALHANCMGQMNVEVMTPSARTEKTVCVVRILAYVNLSKPSCDKNPSAMMVLTGP
jgi:hypothetical protein